jgi:hypothetical protein
MTGGVKAVEMPTTIATVFIGLLVWFTTGEATVTKYTAS